MDTFSETCSMYEAAKLNISGSKIEPAVSFYGKEYSFGQVFSLIDTLADNLSAEFGIGKGSAVTLCVPNSPAAVFAFYAANKLGAAVNLVHPFLPPEKLKESAEKSNSKLIVVYDLYPCAGFEFGVPLLVSDSAAYMGAGAKLYYRLTQKRKARGISFEKYLKERGNPHVGAAQFGAREAAVYLASGGTAGEPKTIAHCNAVCNNLCAKAQEFLGEPLEHYTALYNVLPIFHGYGLCINMHMCMIMRRTNVMCLKFDAKRSAKEIVKSGANILTGVPTMYLKLLGARAFTRGDLSNLKDIWVGGDSVSPRLIEQFNAVLERQGASARIFAGYGLTETAGVCIVNTRARNRAGSVGYPLSGTEIGIYKDGVRQSAGQVGEIYLHSEQFMLGYLGEDASPFVEADGKTWLATGDCGYVDEDGFLYFKQRLKNVLKVSGVPVYPSEIEEAAGQAKGVAKCCAVGVPDPVKGQRVRLYVEPAAGTDTAACEREILDICRRRLIGYAVPKEIVFRKKLAVSIIGKIDRKKLDEEISQESAR